MEALESGAWRAVAGLSERERARCALAEKLSADATRMVEAHWQPLGSLGFDDGACLEVAHVVGIFNHLVRLADGFGLQLYPGTREASATGIKLRRGDPR